MKQLVQSRKDVIDNIFIRQQIFLSFHVDGLFKNPLFLFIFVLVLFSFLFLLFFVFFFFFVQ